jgi:prophage antirepressor-like protein
MRKFKLSDFEGHPVRTFVDDNGLPWAVAMDVGTNLKCGPKPQKKERRGGANRLLSCLKAP